MSTKQCFLPDSSARCQVAAPSSDLLIEGSSPHSQGCFADLLYHSCREALWEALNVISSGRFSFFSLSHKLETFELLLELGQNAKGKLFQVAFVVPDQGRNLVFNPKKEIWMPVTAAPENAQGEETALQRLGAPVAVT